MLKWNWLLPSLSEKCSLLESQKKTMRSEKTWKQIHRSPYWFIREMRKSGLPGEKSLEQLENQLQKQATYDTGPHWWEVSSLSTAPSLLPNKRDCRNEIAVRRGSSRWHYSVFAIFWTRLIVLTLTVSDPQMQLFAYPISWALELFDSCSCRHFKKRKFTFFYYSLYLRESFSSVREVL